MYEVFDATITRRNIVRKQRSGEITNLTRYVLNFRDPKTGKRRQQFYKRQKDAQQAKVELVAAVQQGSYTEKRDIPIVAELFQRWLDDRQGEVKELTHKGYASYRPYIVGPLLGGTSEQRLEYTRTGKTPKKNQLLDMLGDVRITDLSTADIRSWHKLLAEQVGIYTANKAKMFLQGIFSLAAEDYNIRPPAMPRRLARQRQKQPKPILTASQVSTLLKKASEDEEWGVYYAFPFLAGTRPSEQLALQWEDIDFEHNLIRIRRMLERNGIITDYTKTAAGMREIPMCQLLRSLLLEWKVRCPNRDNDLLLVFPGQGKKRQWPLPPSSGGGVLLYSNFRNRVWNKALKQAKLPHVTPHSARHGFISTLQAQGIEVGLVAKLAGHANPTVTLGHYTQAVRGGEEAIQRLQQAYS